MVLGRFKRFKGFLKVTTIAARFAYNVVTITLLRNTPQRGGGGGGGQPQGSHHYCYLLQLQGTHDTIDGPSNERSKDCKEPNGRLIHSHMAALIDLQKTLYSLIHFQMNVR